MAILEIERKRKNFTELNLFFEKNLAQKQDFVFGTRFFRSFLMWKAGEFLIRRLFLDYAPKMHDIHVARFFNSVSSQNTCHSVAAMVRCKSQRSFMFIAPLIFYEFVQFHVSLEIGF